jgi:hypothetical protein
MGNQGYLHMRYVTKDGHAFEMPANGRKIGQVILSCVLGAGIGILIRLVLDLNPGIIVSILSVIKVIGMAIWDMLSSAAHACADFARYVLHTRS